MKRNIILFAIHIFLGAVAAQTFMMNPYARKNSVLLNSKWNAIIDIYGRGESMKFFQNLHSIKKTDFIEYSFQDGLRLDVPGDFNSQMPELKYYEGNIWYQRYFSICKNQSKRQFLYFAGVSSQATVWLNGIEVGKHEGSFTPFQFEITDLAKNGVNDLIVLVNNNRRIDGIPAINFDWWNYGGITRDVILIETPKSFISDYKLQLKKGCYNILEGLIQISGVETESEVEIKIPELNISRKIITNKNGYATFEIEAKPKLWNSSDPKMYEVLFSLSDDTVREEIGFRTIEVKGCEILLNGKPIFLKGVNFHEEIPQRMGRAYSEADAAMILNEVNSLGCNFIRTSHYPQNEYILRKAEKMGIMVWEEIPIWQGIEFSNPVLMNKAENMLKEMIYRDKNRANIIIWSVANETKPSKERDYVLSNLVSLTRTLDGTRLVGAAFDNITYNKSTATFTLSDRVSEVVDVVGINKYMGWYMPYPVSPDSIKWSVATNKPLIMSEFGAEALYGQKGEKDVAYSWSEDYQEEMFKKNIVMFKNINNLCGTCPWVLFDYRSPIRCNSLNQNGWNRKGLVSDKGQRKKAWYIMKEYYEGNKIVVN